MTARPWWRDAVIYEVYPRSFADGNGDGEGTSRACAPGCPTWPTSASTALDLPLVPLADGRRRVRRQRLPRHPPDVRHPRGRRRGARRGAARSACGSSSTSSPTTPPTSTPGSWRRSPPARARRSARATSSATARARTATEPPNNWISALRRLGLDPRHRARRHARPVVPAPVRPGAARPRLDATPRSRDDFDDVLRFWFDRGVDGVRVDAAPAMGKEAGLPDADYGGVPRS